MIRQDDRGRQDDLIGFEKAGFRILSSVCGKSLFSEVAQECPDAYTIEAGMGLVEGGLGEFTTGCPPLSTIELRLTLTV